MQVTRTTPFVSVVTLVFLLCIWCTTATTNSLENECNWSEDMSPCDLLQALQKSVRALEGKMVEFVDQQYIVKSLSRKVQLQNLELHRLRKTVAATKYIGIENNNELLPLAEPYIWLKEEDPIEVTSDSVQKNERDLTSKLEILMKEAQLMKNLTESTKEELESIREAKLGLMEELRLYFLNSTLPLAEIEDRLDDLNRTIEAVIVNRSSNTFSSTKFELMNRRLDDMEAKLSELRRLIGDITNCSVESNGQCMVKVGVTSKSENSKTPTCPKLESSLSPGLILEGLTDDPKPGHTVHFSCSDSRTLYGNAFTRCRTDGSWSHDSLPKCL